MQCRPVGDDPHALPAGQLRYSSVAPIMAGTRSAAMTTKNHGWSVTMPQQDDEKEQSGQVGRNPHGHPSPARRPYRPPPLTARHRRVNPPTENRRSPRRAGRLGGRRGSLRALCRCEAKGGGAGGGGHPVTIALSRTIQPRPVANLEFRAVQLAHRALYAHVTSRESRESCSVLNCKPLRIFSSTASTTGRSPGVTTAT